MIYQCEMAGKAEEYSSVERNAIAAEECMAEETDGSHDCTCGRCYVTYRPVTLAGFALSVEVWHKHATPR